MIEDSLLDEWIANPKLITPEIGRMLAEQTKRLQRNSTQIYVFTQQTFDVWDKKYGDPADTEITPEKFRNWTIEKAVNADYYVAYGKSRLMPQDKPVSQPPIIAPAPVTPTAPKRKVTNQDVINAFFEVYGENEYWGQMVKALGNELPYEMTNNRVLYFVALDKLPRDVNNALGI